MHTREQPRAHKTDKTDNIHRVGGFAVSLMLTTHTHSLFHMQNTSPHTAFPLLQHLITVMIIYIYIFLYICECICVLSLPFAWNVQVDNLAFIVLHDANIYIYIRESAAASLFLP